MLNCSLQVKVLEDDVWLWWEVQVKLVPSLRRFEVRGYVNYRIGSAKRHKSQMSISEISTYDSASSAGFFGEVVRLVEPVSTSIGVVVSVVMESSNSQLHKVA